MNTREDKLMEKFSKARDLIKFTSTKEFNNLCKTVDTTQPLSNKTSNVTQIRNTTNLKNNGLPQEIYESIKNNPLDYSIEDSQIEKLFANNVAKDIINKQNIIHEEKYNSKTTNNIDIDNLKKLISELLDEKLSYFLEEKKKNEKNLSTIRINGDKINFLTTDGDLYTAKLQFIKNINNKK